MAEHLLSVKDLHTSFTTDHGEVHAVNGISFDLDPGKVLGIVGESGSGKSVTAYSIMQILADNGRITGGSVEYKGQDITKWNKNQMAGFRGKCCSIIFQDPMTSLNPVFTIGNQLEEAILLHTKKNRAQAKARAIEMLSLVGVNEPAKRVKQYPYELSGGMRQRVMIAMALACEPDILIADEPTTALDVTIQAQILEIIKDLKEKYHTAIMLITHNFGLVAEVADRIAVMYAGEVVEWGDVFEIFEQPKHPYTRLLMQALPRRTKKEGRLQTIDGSVPRILDQKPGCRFANRCPMASERCFAQTPEAAMVSPTHGCRCFAVGGEEAQTCQQ